MPQWLKSVLLAAGLVIGLAFVVEPLFLVRRRHAAQEAQAARDAEAARGARAAEVAGAAGVAGAATATQLSGACPGREPDSPAAGRAGVVLADYDRLVVTYSRADDTVYVLRPPDAEPRAILRVARLVLPEGPYRAQIGRASCRERV